VSARWLSRLEGRTLRVDRPRTGIRATREEVVSVLTWKLRITVLWIFLAICQTAAMALLVVLRDRAWSATHLAGLGNETGGEPIQQQITATLLAATSTSYHPHPALAGTADKRPAAPLVRDEEAADSNPATPKAETQVVT
jgi:hypothetical protein